MKQRPPISDDPTSEEEAPEFDGTVTVRLDDTYRVRVATTSERADEPGSFATKEDGTAGRLKALENAARNLAAREPKPLKASGDEPDATGVFVLPKIDR